MRMIDQGSDLRAFAEECLKLDIFEGIVLLQGKFRNVLADAADPREVGAFLEFLEAFQGRDPEDNAAFQRRMLANILQWGEEALRSQLQEFRGYVQKLGLTEVLRRVRENESLVDEHDGEDQEPLWAYKEWTPEDETEETGMDNAL